MKQTIILWTGAFVISFLFGFANRLISPEYPVTGSFGINMKKVIYKFEKVYRGNDNYKIVLGTEVDSLNGSIMWRVKDSNSGWNASPMKFSANTLTGVIPHQPPSTLVEYRVKVWKDSRTFYLPLNGKVIMKYLGSVPSSIMGFYFFTLYLALFFSVRTGLDYFNENQKIKKLSLFTIMIWIANVIVFNPVKRSYELSTRIGSTVLPITDLFDIRHLDLLIIWLLGIILIFNLKNYKIWAAIISGATLIAFLFV
ncbi:MAG: hypothetical protein WCE54_15250 [Ignavibacteriaceae bacterium]